ncbi:MAG: hypothetical protein ABSF29_07280 [Tepidisphaeraceae bacterium]|jgi:ElaB/YqjD/DUF883 family membrane-anchored ribosome-binding protein
MESLKDRVAQLRERGADSIATAEKKIKENPLSSTMIAFGVGFIVAKFLHRRH